MSNAKNALLTRTGSHWIEGNRGSSSAEGIDKEEVFFYFDAEWRGSPVHVEVSADRYAAGPGRPAPNRLTDWRVYARAAYNVDHERPGGRGDPVTETARSALSELCVPIARAWLDTDAYRASFRAALGHMILRKFEDRYSVEAEIPRALATFGDRLTEPVRQAIFDALGAYHAWELAKDHAVTTINEEAS